MGTSPVVAVLPSVTWCNGADQRARATPVARLRRAERDSDVNRTTRKLFALSDKLTLLRAERAQVEAELNMHEHINDDAQRDAAMGNAADRAEAYETAADVSRFRRHLARLEAKETKLEARRRRLLGKLD
jgi:chromosome segregation ATPase